MVTLQRKHFSARLDYVVNKQRPSLSSEIANKKLYEKQCLVARCC